MELENLKKELKFEEIEWKIQSKKKDTKGNVEHTVIVPYINRKTVINRFNDCVGAENWKVEFKEWQQVNNLGGLDLETLKFMFTSSYNKAGDLEKKVNAFISDIFTKSQLCGISVKIDNEWVTKWDGAENTDIESVKGGISSSFKRAANMWGIGLELSDFPIIKIEGNVNYINFEHLDFFKKIYETPIGKRKYSYTFTKNYKDLFEQGQIKALTKEEEIMEAIKKIAEKEELEKALDYFSAGTLNDLSYDDLIFIHDNLVKKRRTLTKEEVKELLSNYPADRNIQKDIKMFFKKDDVNELTYNDMQKLLRVIKK